MKPLYPRLVASLLAAALTFDPGTAAGICGRPQLTSPATPQILFCEQALASQALKFLQTLLSPKARTTVLESERDRLRESASDKSSRSVLRWISAITAAVILPQILSLKSASFLMSVAASVYTSIAVRDAREAIQQEQDTGLSLKDLDRLERRTWRRVQTEEPETVEELGIPALLEWSKRNRLWMQIQFYTFMAASSLSFAILFFKGSSGASLQSVAAQVVGTVFSLTIVNFLFFETFPTHRRPISRLSTWLLWALAFSIFAGVLHLWFGIFNGNSLWTSGNRFDSFLQRSLPLTASLAGGSLGIGMLMRLIDNSFHRSKPDDGGSGGMPAADRTKVEAYMSPVLRALDRVEKTGPLSYERMGRALLSIEAHVCFWVDPRRHPPDGSALQHPSDGELVELGNRLRSEMVARGYRQTGGHIHQDIALLNANIAEMTTLRESERRIWLLIGGTKAERLFGLWSANVKVTSHLLLFGLHMLHTDEEIVDVEEFLIPLGQEYISHMLEWVAEQEPDEEANQLVATRGNTTFKTLTFLDLLSWGLLVQGNPAIYYKIYKTDNHPNTHRTYRYVLDQGGHQRLADHVLNRMLRMRRVMGENGKVEERERTPEELEGVENLLAYALSLPSTYWKERRAVPPWVAQESHPDHARLKFRPMNRSNVRAHSPYVEPALEILTHGVIGQDEERRALMEQTYFRLFPNLEAKVAKHPTSPVMPNATSHQAPYHGRSRLRAAA